jgi:phosphomannomutase/phosphoglucomutase
LPGKTFYVVSILTIIKQQERYQMAYINPSIFRAADMRGRVNEEELNPASVELIGRGYGTFLARRGIKQAVVGYDSRECSPSFHEAIVNGLLSTGCDVISIGLALTPMVYWAQYYFNSDGAVMITGSHNPPNWSGFKMGLGKSVTILGQEVQEVRQIIEQDDFVSGKGNFRTEEIAEPYWDDLLSRSKISRRFKIVVDAGNGTAGKFAPELFRRAGCEVIELYTDLDTSFPHHFPDPTIVEGRKDVELKVLETGADMGFSFDGDGDRFGVNDDKAQIIWADQLMILWSRDILSRHPGAKIVFDVKCSQSLVEDIKAHGGIPVMWKTGHPFIKSKIKEEKAELGGEMSGHIFFVENFFGFDDALYAGLRLLQYMSTTEESLSEVMAKVPYYVATPEIRVHCPDDSKYQVANDMARRFKEEGFDVIDIDGARVNFDQGWGLCRASSNLPELILRFEAKNPEAIDEYKASFKKRMNDYPQVSSEWKNG